MSNADPYNQAQRKADFLRVDHLAPELRRRSVRGGATILAAQFLRHFVISLAATAVLARLLTPRDFGLLAMVLGLTNLLERFKDIGLAMATVQRQEIAHEQISTLFWINAAVGLAATLITAACAPLIAWFYGEPRLATITLALAAMFCITGLAVQHRALLHRQMRFAAASAVEIVATAVGAAAGIASALLGAGYWSLVVMQLSATGARAVGTWTACGWRPGMPRRGTGVRSMLSFGGHLTGANLLNYLVRNIDNVLIGWRWGADALGFYSKAYQLLLLPIRQLNTPLTTLAIPALSRLQDEPQRFRAYYIRALQLITTLGMPLVVFTFVAAERVVLLILGDQWLEVVSIFRVLAPAAFLGTFNVATGWVYVSLGHTRRQLRWNMLSAPAGIAGFVVGLPWGPLGVAAAFTITRILLIGPGLLYCFNDTGLRVRDLLTAIWRPGVTALGAGAATLVVHSLFSWDLALFRGLALDFLLFAVLYTLGWLLLPRGPETVRGLLALARDLQTTPAPDSKVAPRRSGG